MSWDQWPAVIVYPVGSWVKLLETKVEGGKRSAPGSYVPCKRLVLVRLGVRHWISMSFSNSKATG